MFTRIALLLTSLGSSQFEWRWNERSLRMRRWSSFFCKLYVDAVDSKSLVRSFEKVFCALDDIVIDCPMAPLAILAMLCGCIKGEAIERKILTKLPESLMNSGLQVGDPTIKSMLSEVAADLKKFKQLVPRCSVSV